MKWEQDVRFPGEGFSMRRVRVDADTPEEATQKAVEMYREQIQPYGKPRLISGRADDHA